MNKKVIGWVVGILIVIGIIAANNDQPSTGNTTEQVNESSTEQEVNAEQETSETLNKPTITKSEFEQIKNGMTYEEVSAIIGGEGELLSETGTPGDQFYTVMYQYDGEGDLGANANFMFQGGKLISKAQIGLK